ncbi:MAG TPA: primosomal protein N' [Erysipelotrichaceae bacterium]|nr:primosomal protein N' [Erysipelotrichaceae bacterium]
MQLLEVLIEYAKSSLNRPFSYSYKGEKELSKGIRVLVTFNNRHLVGYVLNVTKTDKTIEELNQESGFEILEIEDIIDESPLLNDELLALLDEASSYYLAPKISFLHAMLPPSLSPRKSSLKAPRIAYDYFYEIVNDDEENLTNKQIELLRFIKREGRVLKREVSKAKYVLKMIETGHIREVKEEKRRLKIPDYHYEEPPELTIEQIQVIEEFNKSEDLVYLLQGVTGSGKTEVYLSLSEQTFAQGKSVLMLVPEISLTPMMVEYYLHRFSNHVAILHSELTPAERYDEYRKIARGECQIVVGVRSAVFAPLQNIGLIVLDEEHTESYKQDTLPFYHAREIAIMRARYYGAKVLLGSATPSLESRARGSKNVYHMLFLNKRINDQKLPKTKIVNMLDYHNIDRESYIFSHALREALHQTLARNEQAILLINRRGFSTHVTCRNCGHVFKCPTCDIALTYHKSDNMLKCHHCEYVEPLSDNCPECGSSYLIKTGFGTEKIVEEVKRLFPSATVLRLDSDSAKSRRKVPEIIEAFRKKQANVLVGTQMIAKGHDFPDVTLVGIVLADIGLSMPSFRSSERAFQLITQAIGRSGRKDKPGYAIIQTYLPSHYAITFAARQNYELFYRKEMEMRKLQFYPPYAFLASVTIKGRNEEHVIANAYLIADYLNEQLLEKVQILGPSTPYISIERGFHLRNILIKYVNRELVQSVLNKMQQLFSFNNQYDLLINIDPYNF